MGSFELPKGHGSPCWEVSPAGFVRGFGGGGLWLGLGLFGGGGFVASPLCPLFLPCGWSSAASVLPRAAIGAPIAGDYQKECLLSGSIGAGE